MVLMMPFHALILAVLAHLLQSALIAYLVVTCRALFVYFVTQSLLFVVYALLQGLPAQSVRLGMS